MRDRRGRRADDRRRRRTGECLDGGHLDSPGLRVRLHAVGPSAPGRRPRSGIGAMRLVLAADTLSIATMELVDNLVYLIVPGAMDAGLADALFWLSTLLSLVIAFFAAWPVNRILLQRGRGHALTHGYHGAAAPAEGWRRFIPHIGTGAL